ncbi:MAG: hypothetical protein WC058_05785 [Phycisphaeraceae bacterium]
MKTILVVVVMGLLIGSTARAQTDATLWVTPWLENSHADVSGQAMIFNQGHTDANGKFGLGIYQSQGRARIDPANADSPVFGYDVTYLDIDSNDPRLPERLTNQRLAAGAHLGELDKWNFALVGGIGFASSNAYHDGQAWYGFGTLIATYDDSPTTSWTVALNYDGNRSVLPDIPLPGVAWTNRTNPKLTYSLGIPSSWVFWKPCEQFTLAANYAIPYTVNLTATVPIVKEVRLYAGFYNSLQAFHPDDSRGGDRIFFQQRRAEAGVTWVPCENFDLTVAGGWAFDQHFSRGYQTLNPHDQFDVSDEPYLRVKLNFTF